jgi:hypothetical protein
VGTVKRALSTKLSSRAKGAAAAPRPTPETRGAAVRWALVLSLLLLALRLRLSDLVGFGDAEALYAAYALHPQPAYLDHPGLIGVIARALGAGAAPSPLVAHRFTAVAATAIPWIGLAAARAAGAPAARAYVTFFALCLLPEMSIGLFGLTPDLPLCALWLASLGCVAAALRSDPGSRTALAGMLLGGLCVGVAITAKATGALLALAVAIAMTASAARKHRRSVAPYLGVVSALIVIAPLLSWESAHGFPLLRHRFVATQASAGVSLRNVGALVGGQLLYVTPPFLYGSYRALKELWGRRADAVDRLLWLAAVVPGVPLVLLCLWSRVAEPHWLGPAYLSLAVALPRLAPLGTKTVRACAAIGVVAPILAFVLVTTPLVPRLSGQGYRPRYDLVNDLYAWRAALPLVRSAIEEARSEGYAPAVVGPHWTVCGQLHAGLGAGVPVGCRTKQGDDFAGWLPETQWSRAPVLIYVTDDRFPGEPARDFPGRDVARIESTRIYRGGRVVRTIRVARLERAASATRLPLGR